MSVIYMSSNKTGWKGKITWSAVKDEKNNTSTVYAQVYTWKTDNQPSSGYTNFTGTLCVGSKEVGISFPQQNAASEENPQFIAELEDTINHNDDGTASVYIYCRIDAPSPTVLAGNPLQGGGTYPLDTIYRTVKITSTKNIDFGDNCLITWTPASKSFHYKLRFQLGGKDIKTTGIISPNTTNSYSYSGYSIPVDEAINIKNSESGTVSVTLYQYSDSSGSTQVGTAATSSFVVTLKSDVVPKIDSCSAIVNNSANSAIANWGVAISGYSAVSISASASGVYGSDIVSYSITGGYTANVYNSKPNTDLNYNGAVINSSGNKVFTITCTDSRGRVSNPVTTDTILFLPYTMPRINSVTAEKNDRGTDGISDDRMVVTATWEIDSVGSRNSASAVVYYKETSAVDWTLHSGNLTNGSPFTLENLRLDGDNEFKSYNFRVVVTDSVGNSSSKESFAASTKVLLDFKAGGDGLGIGGVCSSPGLEVSMDATFFKEIYISGKQKTLSQYIREQIPASSIVDIIYPVGSIYISMASDSPAKLFGGTWEKLEGRFLLGSGSFNSNTDMYYGDLHESSKVFTAGDRGGQDFHKLTVSEMPKHSHQFNGHADSSPTGSGDYHVEYNGSIGNDQYIQSAGNDDPHNNMPPYLVVNMWRRIS